MFDHNFNMLEVLRQQSARHRDKVAFTFLAERERTATSWAYRELDRRAQAIGARLREIAKPGERALLLYPCGLEYIAGLFGCFYSGVTPVPVYPPQGSSNGDRLASIMNNCQPSLALTLETFRKSVDSLTGAEVPGGLPTVATDQLSAGDGSLPETWQPPTNDNRLALLQYTSGSTASPKGVMVTHASLLHNLRILQDMYEHTEDTVQVSWLPIYHDMGLIGSVLSTVYVGGHCVFMSPASFIKHPIRWLEAISFYGGTFSGGPNFGYDLCLEKITEEQKQRLDLSRWKVAVNGSEPVRSHTNQEFLKAFASCGLSPDAIRPSYGLAEGTLVVTASDKGSGSLTRSFDAELLERRGVVEIPPSAKQGRKLVSCGKADSSQRVKIVDPDSLTLCAPDRVGEIWVAGPSVCMGYWGKEELSDSVFRAFTRDTGEGPFLRTGDLGFLHDGDLYIAGRLKDLIIVRGRNHYAQDIEITVEQSHPAVRANCAAAFSVELDGNERLVIVCEIKRSDIRFANLHAIAAGIRAAVAERHELDVYAIEFVKSNCIPKTSSGKIQRSLCRNNFLTGSLEKLQPQENMMLASNGRSHDLSPQPHKSLQFSLFYFSSNEAEFKKDKYRLLLEGARFADEHGFTAVWIPERHFHPFGGLFPNPSVLASALAMTTRKIRIRAGSVVLPLHNPIRVAEEWAVVDNLSSGRVDMAFARGWNPNDFVLAPANFQNSLQVLYQSLDAVRQLWRGNPIVVRNGKGEEVRTQIYPQPQQSELPVWITCSGGVERFIEAGAGGWNILTALLFQSSEELAYKIACYREARKRNGHDPNQGHVTLMLHTFLGIANDEVKEIVRGPFIEYLRSSADLWQHGSKALAEMTEEERQVALNFAFERYYQTSGLFGTPETCVEKVEQLRVAGVDEIACLIDFGIDPDQVLRALYPLRWLQEKATALARSGGSPYPTMGASNAQNHECLDHKFQLPPEQAGNGFHQEPRPAMDRMQPKFPVANGNRGDEQELLLRMKDVVVSAISHAIHCAPETIPASRHFLSLGVSSLSAIQIIHAIEEQFDLKIPQSMLFEFSTVDSLSHALVRMYHDQLTAKAQSGSR